MKNKKNLKQKVSLDLWPENYEAIEDYKWELIKMSNLRKTTTQTINECVSLLLDSSDDFKNELARFCKQKLQNTLPTNFHEEDKACELRKWEALYYFLTKERGLFDNEKGLKRIDFQNGYIIVPDDWIFVNPHSVNNEAYLYPYIVEFRNDGDYDLPHFFLLRTNENIDDYAEKQFLQEATEVYPPLKDVVPKIVHGIIQNGKMLNYEIWNKSPEPGFFPFPKVYGYRKSLMGELWVPKNLLEELEAD